MVVHSARMPASRASGGQSMFETLVYSPTVSNDALEMDRKKPIASSMLVSMPAACRSFDLSVRRSIISQVHTFFLCHHFHCICVRLMWSSGFSLM
jgi:hypothetical protein